jgi:hypothetical protein
VELPTKDNECTKSLVGGSTTSSRDGNIKGPLRNQGPFDVLRVQSIPSEQCRPWLLKKHYARRLPPISYAFGAYRGTELIGVVTYGLPASPSLCLGICGPEWKDSVIELNRLCCENSPNVASSLVGRSLRLLPRPTIVVSYADTGHNHIGYIYQATNFLYTGKSDDGRKTPRADRIAVDGKHGRHQGRRENGTVDTSIELVYRNPKHRYIFFVGSKKEVNQMKNALLYTIQTYPKGETKRYDAGDKLPTQDILF